MRASLRTYQPRDRRGQGGENHARTRRRSSRSHPPAGSGASSGCRRRPGQDNQRFLLVAAASILLVLAFGLLSRGSAAPPAAQAGAAASPIPADPTMSTVLVARGDHDDRAEEDGVTSTYRIRPGRRRARRALERLEFRVGDAELVEVSVNGRDRTKGVRGAPAKPVHPGDAGGSASSSG